MLIKISAIETQIASLEKKLPKLLELNRIRLKKRADELAVQIDRDRLDQEMVILANRSDIDEEIVRMRSHTTEVKRLLGTDKSIGRKLDFLMQEMNREANTLGSKIHNIQLFSHNTSGKLISNQDVADFMNLH